MRSSGPETLPGIYSMLGAFVFAKIRSVFDADEAGVECPLSELGYFRSGS